MDKRQHPRVTLESQCKANFHLGGTAYNDIIVSNLGVDGCCLQMPPQAMAELTNRSTLEGWELIHPSLPSDPIQAKVVWSHPDVQARKGFIETGIQFVNAPANYKRDLDRYVTNMSKSYPPEH